MNKHKIKGIILASIALSMFFAPQNIFAHSGTNHAPVINRIQDYTIGEMSALSLTFSATDADGDSMRFEPYKTSLPAGASLSAEGKFDWTPSYSQAGVYTINIAVVDEHGAKGIKSFKITVRNTNQAPVIQLPETYTVNGEQFTIEQTTTSCLFASETCESLTFSLRHSDIFTIDFNVDDPDRDKITFSAAHIHAYDSLGREVWMPPMPTLYYAISSGGLLRLDIKTIPRNRGIANVTVEVKAQDAQRGLDTFWVTVNLQNQAPIFEIPDTYTLNGDEIALDTSSVSTACETPRCTSISFDLHRGDILQMRLRGMDPDGEKISYYTRLWADGRNYYVFPFYSYSSDTGIVVVDTNERFFLVKDYTVVIRTSDGVNSTEIYLNIHLINQDPEIQLPDSYMLNGEEQATNTSEPFAFTMKKSDTIVVDLHAIDGDNDVITYGVRRQLEDGQVHPMYHNSESLSISSEGVLTINAVYIPYNITDFVIEVRVDDTIGYDELSIPVHLLNQVPQIQRPSSYVLNGEMYSIIPSMCSDDLCYTPRFQLHMGDILEIDYPATDTDGDEVRMSAYADNIWYGYPLPSGQHFDITPNGHLTIDTSLYPFNYYYGSWTFYIRASDWSGEGDRASLYMEVVR